VVFLSHNISIFIRKWTKQKEDVVPPHGSSFFLCSSIPSVHHSLVVSRSPKNRRGPLINAQVQFQFHHARSLVSFIWMPWRWRYHCTESNLDVWNSPWTEFSIYRGFSSSDPTCLASGYGDDGVSVKSYDYDTTVRQLAYHEVHIQPQWVEC
jgi:hypothetical protein